MWRFLGTWPAFQYQPLDNSRNEIRLLTLLSRSFARELDREGQILCALQHVSLDESPQYNALSYTWGQQAEKAPIWVNNQALAVSENLYLALKALQHESLNFPVWVDAVCIHQADDEEKSHQVQKMYRIYESATVVTVWLGPTANESEIAMKYLQRVGEDYLSKAPMTFDDYISSHVQTTDADTATFPVPATTAFLERPWWRRIWVQQEVAAATDVRFICGNEHTQSFPLSVAVEIFHKTRENMMRRKTLTQYERDIARWWGKERALKLLRTTPDTPYKESSKPLLSLLYEGFVIGRFDLQSQTPLEASDPRDLVFGLFGLASDISDLGLLADYSKSTQKVYTETAKAIICSGDLSILSFSQHPRLLPDLPSWAPDWSAPICHSIYDPGQNPGKPYSGVPTGIPPTSQNYRSFDASKGTIPSATVVHDENGAAILSISGIIVGSVTNTSDGWVGSSDGYVLASVIPFMYGMVSLLGIQANDLISFLKSENGAKLWVTAITDKERLSNQGYCRVRPSYFKAIHDRTIELLERINEAHSDEYRELYLRDEDSGIHHYLTSMNTLAVGRRPFVTEQGFLGQGPEAMQVGDVVVIFMGHPVPLILRRRADAGYQLVGEAYVHGIMDGELLENNPDAVKFDIY